MRKQIHLKVNGRSHAVHADEHTPLLHILRNDLRLNGPKFGCGLAQCGACSVLADGREIRACVTPVGQVQSREIVTNEGLGTPARPNPLQAAFIASQAAQCGYCTSGMVIAAAALLKTNPNPSRNEIRAGLEGHLCRCGTHLRILQAVENAAKAGVRT